MLIWFPAPRAFCGDKSFIACALMDNGTELSNCANECSNKLSSSGVQWSKNSFACCWFCKDARPWRLSNDDNLFLFFQRQKKKKRDGGGGGVNACCFRRRKRILRPPRRIIHTKFQSHFSQRVFLGKKTKEGTLFERTTKRALFFEEKKRRRKKNLGREKSPFASALVEHSRPSNCGLKTSHLWKLPFMPFAVAMMM